MDGRIALVAEDALAQDIQAAATVKVVWSLLLYTSTESQPLYILYFTFRHSFDERWREIIATGVHTYYHKLRLVIPPQSAKFNSGRWQTGRNNERRRAFYSHSWLPVPYTFVPGRAR
jgi:hypothetical protein